MQRRLVLLDLSFILALVFSILPGSSGKAIAQDNSTAQITTPKTGDTLFGVVTIQGTASAPNMMRYTLEFDLQDDPVDRWFPIAGPVTQQVTNGVLGQWDTTKLQGRYQIRLRVILRSGTVMDSIVQNLFVNNKQPTALPTVLPTATPALPTPSPTAGPSPTSQIQQPPTNTARAIQPTVAIGPTNLPSADVGSQPQGIIDLDALRSAFCSGIYVAVFAFAVFGAYSLVHPRVRRIVTRLREEFRR